MPNALGLVKNNKEIEQKNNNEKGGILLENFIKTLNLTSWDEQRNNC